MKPDDDSGGGKLICNEVTRAEADAKAIALKSSGFRASPAFNDLLGGGDGGSTSPAFRVIVDWIKKQREETLAFVNHRTKKFAKLMQKLMMQIQSGARAEARGPPDASADEEEDRGLLFDNFVSIPITATSNVKGSDCMGFFC